MFSKSRINDPGPKAAESKTETKPTEPKATETMPMESKATPETKASTAAETPTMTDTTTDLNKSPSSIGIGGESKPKASPSLLSADLTINGNLRTTGDIQVEGTVEGDIRAHLLTVGETATIKGEVVADDIVVNGRVVGKVRGIKVRLTASAKVEGDIIHKTIAIESGAHFEGSVQRQEDPIANAPKPLAPPKSAYDPSPKSSGDSSSKS